MKYVVAVSGGVDSVVLLDMLVHQKQHDIIVAHFDHGIRNESSADARFVAELAKQYGLFFVSEWMELGADASEATARYWRYKFLKKIAKKQNAKLVTAHHQDDLIESIAINIVRGTGWRGLAVFSDETIFRPLINKTKSDLVRYAFEHHLEWVEDATNHEPRYLRNVLRKQLARLNTTARDRLVVLWEQQKRLKADIAWEQQSFATYNSRYFFIMAPENAALDILRTKTSAALTLPQLKRLLFAIKTARAHSTYQAGNGITVEFTRRHFTVKNTGELL